MIGFFINFVSIFKSDTVFKSKNSNQNRSPISLNDCHLLSSNPPNGFLIETFYRQWWLITSFLSKDASRLETPDRFVKKLFTGRSFPLDSGQNLFLELRSQFDFWIAEDPCESELISYLVVISAWCKVSKNRTLTSFSKFSPCYSHFVYFLDHSNLAKWQFRPKENRLLGNSLACLIISDCLICPLSYQLEFWNKKWNIHRIKQDWHRSAWMAYRNSAFNKLKHLSLPANLVRYQFCTTRLVLTDTKQSKRSTRPCIWHMTTSK